MKQLPIIPKDKLTEVCKIGQGHECCRFIVGGAAGIECAKSDPGLFEQINNRVEAGTFNAKGDNCPGLELVEVH